MDIFIRLQIVVLLVLPFVLGILLRRGTISDKHLAIAIASSLGLLMGTYEIYLSNSTSILSVPASNWLSAIIFASVSWLFVYALVRWLLKELLKR